MPREFEGLDVVYLEVEDILVLYAEIYGCSVEEAGDQLRSRDGLDAACARPAQWAHYREADIVVQAAVLAHGIAETQPFHDGNKRSAVAALRFFLRLNGYRLVVSPQEFADWILDLSADLSPDGLADRMRSHVVSVIDG